MKSTFLNLHEVVILLTIVETLFLCLALKLLPAARMQPRNLLLVFFLLVAGTLTTTLLTWNPYLETLPIAESRLIPMVLATCLLLEGPVLYAYLRSLSEELQLFRWINLLHLVPALLVILLIGLADIRVLDWLPWNWPQLPANKRLAVKWTWAIFKCWPAVYVLACFYAEYRLRRAFQQVYSNISRRELRWADMLLGGFFIHWFWSFIGYFAGPYLSSAHNDLVGIINNYFTVLLVNGLFVFALANGRQLLDRNWLADDLQDTAPPSTDLEPRLVAITQAVTEQKLYLDSQINLERFAERAGLKARDLSAILNSHYGKNFFEFINALRVDEVKRTLVEQPQRTILELAFAAGFNSQSAFQRFFKRLVGMTPSAYRRLHVEQSAGVENRKNALE